jgi:hypothetical protein
MEGINQTLLWAHIVADIKSLFYPLLYGIEDGTVPTVKLQTMLSDLFTDVYSRFETTDVVYQEAFTSLNETLSLDPNESPTQFLNASFSAIMLSAQTVVESFGWEIPSEPEGEGPLIFAETLDSILRVFNLTFGNIPFARWTYLIVMLT